MTLRWIGKRLNKLSKGAVRLAQTPGRALGRVVAPWRLAAGRLPDQQRGSVLLVDDDCLLVFYDLGHWPITYDPAWVMVAADIVRRDKGLAGLYFVFVPSEDWEGGSEGKDYFRVVDGEARRQRVHDMLVPMVWLLPTTRGYTMARSREAAAKMAVLAGERR